MGSGRSTGRGALLLLRAEFSLEVEEVLPAIAEPRHCLLGVSQLLPEIQALLCGAPSSWEPLGVQGRWAERTMTAFPIFVCLGGFHPWRYAWLVLAAIVGTGKRRLQEGSELR